MARMMRRIGRGSATQRIELGGTTSTVSTDTFTAGTGVNIGSRNEVKKEGHFAFISLVLTTTQNISANSTLVTTTNGMSLGTTTYVYAKKEDGTMIVLTTNGDKLITDFAISSGTILRIGTTIWTPS